MEREYESRAPDLLKEKEKTGLLKVVNWETGEAEAFDPTCDETIPTAETIPTVDTEPENKTGLSFVVAIQTPPKKAFNIMRKENLLLHVDFLKEILGTSILMEGV